MSAAQSPHAKATRVQIADVLGEPELNALERRILLGLATGMSREAMARAPETVLSPDALASYRVLIERRLGGEPIAYLCGTREFYGRDFLVDPRVLIPRPESELLIDLAARTLLTPEAFVLDLGTGSGCLAITLKLEHPRWRVTGLDRSSAALDVAGANATRLKTTIDWLKADLCEQANCIEVLQDVLRAGGFQLIICNPPYLAANDRHLFEGDLRFEPKQALTDGLDGASLLFAAIDLSAHLLAPGGWLLLEHGFDQAAMVRARLVSAGFSEPTTWHDLAGHERVTGALLTD